MNKYYFTLFNIRIIQNDTLVTIKSNFFKKDI